MNQGPSMSHRQKPKSCYTIEDMILLALANITVTLALIVLLKGH